MEDCNKTIEAIEIRELGQFGTDSAEGSAYLEARSKMLKKLADDHFPIEASIVSEKYTASNGKQYLMSIDASRVESKTYRLTGRQVLASNPKRHRAVKTVKGGQSVVDCCIFLPQTPEPPLAREGDVSPGAVLSVTSYEMSPKEVLESMEGYIKQLLGPFLLKRSREASKSKAAIFDYYLNYYRSTVSRVIRTDVATLSRTVSLRDCQAVKMGSLIPEMSDCSVVTPTAYRWAPNEVFANFANRRLGGGVLDHGWVQEEFLTACIDLLPQIGRLRAIYKDLDVNPALFEVEAWFTPNLKFYGRRTGLIAQHDQIVGDPTQVLLPLTKPCQVFWLSMAAICIGKRAPRPQEVTQMLLTAYRAFYLSLLACHSRSLPKIVINTGNWGAGAFGWDARMSYLIQYFAFGLAHRRFRRETGSKVEVTYHHHAYDTKTLELIRELKVSQFREMTTEDLATALLTLIR
jgi:hypothetical protein